MDGANQNQGQQGSQAQQEPSANQQGQQQAQQQTQQQEKTFTQEEVNRMLANEKRQGRNSVLKELGIDPEDKDGVKNAKGTLDSHRTDAERAAATLKAEQDAKNEAITRASAAERKLSLLQNGCIVDYIDEVSALVAAKVTDSVNFDAALKAVKEKFPSFFNDTENKGTGKGQGHKKTEAGKPGEFGARLAGDALKGNTEKNPYFSN